MVAQSGTTEREPTLQMRFPFQAAAAAAALVLLGLLFITRETDYGLLMRVVSALIFPTSARLTEDENNIGYESHNLLPGYGGNDQAVWGLCGEKKNIMITLFDLRRGQS